MAASIGTPIFLQRVDGCPLQEDPLSFPLKSWLSLIPSSLNTSLAEIEKQLNLLSQFGLTIPSFTTAQITVLATGAPNGTLWYATDGTPPNVVVKINGALRQITTTAFP
jgi:hypothetical protein